MADFFNQIESCTECGICGTTCPFSVVTGNNMYSPENKIKQLFKVEKGEELSQEEYDTIYLCSRCGACNDVCPENIDIMGIIQEERGLLAKQGREPAKTTHISSNILKAYNPKGEVIEDRVALWRTDDLELSEDSPIAYMAGCWVSLANVSMAQDTIRILNKCGIRPRTIPEEKCCGLFLIDNGHIDEVREYAEEYLDYLESLGFETLLVSCPACYNVIGKFYEGLCRKPKFKVVHTLELFKSLYDEKKIRFSGDARGTVTIKDACPMTDMFDIPRELLTEMGYTIEESFDKKPFCCGAPGGAKPNYPEIATDVLRFSMDKAKGMDALVSYCPFCLHNINGLKAAESIDTEALDLSHYIWKNMVR